MKEFFSLEFFSRHWSWFAIGILAVFSCVLGVQRLRDRSSIKNKKEFIAIQRSLDRFQEGYFLDIDSLEAIEKMVLSHPELHSRFDFLLTESYLSNGNTQKAIAFGQESLKRTEPLTPHHLHQYAATSLLISENKLGQAFLDAETLEQELKATALPSNETLRAFNLLRIVFLAKESGNEQRLNSAWEELDKLPSFTKLKGHFSEGKITLEDYLQPSLHLKK